MEVCERSVSLGVRERTCLRRSVYEGSREDQFGIQEETSRSPYKNRRGEGSRMMTYRSRMDHVGVVRGSYRDTRTVTWDSGSLTFLYRRTTFPVTCRLWVVCNIAMPFGDVSRITSVQGSQAENH